MKNILLLTVILAVGVIAFIYYKKKTSSGISVNAVRPTDVRVENTVTDVSGIRGQFI